MYRMYDRCFGVNYNNLHLSQVNIIYNTLKYPENVGRQYNYNIFVCSIA